MTDSAPPTNSDTHQVHALLQEWARATREGRQDDVLQHHAADVRLFDVLPPLQYTSAADYRASWDEWQPDTQGEAVFAWQDLHVEAGPALAFAYGLIRCGGTLADGRSFEDVVRATFGLRKVDGGWCVVHQHVSKPWQAG